MIVDSKWIPFYAACALGFLNTLPLLLRSTTEFAYSEGQWYINFLTIVPLLTWVTLFAVWKNKKWGVWTYTLLTLITEIVLFRHNIFWSIYSLIIPLVVTVTFWVYYRGLKYERK